MAVTYDGNDFELLDQGTGWDGNHATAESLDNQLRHVTTSLGPGDHSATLTIHRINN